jgi:hypothetical protein
LSESWFSRFKDEQDNREIKTSSRKSLNPANPDSDKFFKTTGRLINFFNF